VVHVKVKAVLLFADAEIWKYCGRAFGKQALSEQEVPFYTDRMGDRGEPTLIL
jgi:hypothetical protein